VLVAVAPAPTAGSLPVERLPGARGDAGNLMMPGPSPTVGSGVSGMLERVLGGVVSSAAAFVWERKPMVQETEHPNPHAWTQKTHLGQLAVERLS